MADGYYDEAGNFIPGDFANALDLPSATPTDSAGAAKAKGDIGYNKAKAAKAMTAYTSASAEAKRQMALYNAKGATAAQKQAATTARARALAQMKSSTTARNAALKSQATAQSAYYTATGQYDKLLEGQNRDAYAALVSLFNGFGLGTLAPKIFDYAKQGYGADVISLLLADTKEYKERFAGNELRTKAGLAVLSPAEYLSTERSYRQILQDAGLPKGFYDSPADFTKWIAGDVSPTEIKGRVDLAVTQGAAANGSTKQALDLLYGVDESHVAAYFLDPSRALPLLQKQANAATFGAEALKRNLALNKQDLEDFATAGLSLSTVSQGFQTVADVLPNIQAIAERWGESFSQGEAEKDIIGGGWSNGSNENPTDKRKRLVGAERGLFSGSGGATPGGLQQYQGQ